MFCTCGGLCLFEELVLNKPSKIKKGIKRGIKTVNRNFVMDRRPGMEGLGITDWWGFDCVDEGGGDWMVGFNGQEMRRCGRLIGKEVAEVEDGPERDRRSTKAGRSIDHTIYSCVSEWSVGCIFVGVCAGTLRGGSGESVGTGSSPGFKAATHKKGRDRGKGPRCYRGEREVGLHSDIARLEVKGDSLSSLARVLDIYPLVVAGAWSAGQGGKRVGFFLDVLAGDIHGELETAPLIGARALVSCWMRFWSDSWFSEQSTTVVLFVAKEGLLGCIIRIGVATIFLSTYPMLTSSPTPVLVEIGDQEWVGSNQRKSLVEECFEVLMHLWFFSDLSLILCSCLFRRYSWVVEVIGLFAVVGKPCAGYATLAAVPHIPIELYLLELLREDFLVQIRLVDGHEYDAGLKPNGVGLSVRVSIILTVVGGGCGAQPITSNQNLTAARKNFAGAALGGNSSNCSMGVGHSDDAATWKIGHSVLVFNPGSVGGGTPNICVSIEDSDLRRLI
ncbi:hypothetical protein Tco_0596731 [Tanacetum coccineum]